ncbi:MAG: hypothetical protein IJF88_00710 [Oscillospiraceae bacterium]|nr:hypothetical protein [Oscillospiraceae bacterium]
MMQNEFGVKLDRAGYAPSIMQRERCGCALCGREFGAKLDRHEPWGGLANRRKSQEFGLWVSLCHFGCHEGPGSVHDDPAKNRALRRMVQAQAMCVYGWSREEWIRRFGKSELAEEDKPWMVGLPGVPGPEDRAGARLSVRAAVALEGFAVEDGPELPF